MIDGYSIAMWFAGVVAALVIGAVVVGIALGAGGYFLVQMFTH